ncbi:MAG: hypothetical protein HY594_01380 [Candidatus Omnitrophica bacterium]|nr:hypothetical protein [Candidatus Omnitrophota bacterium]
MSRHSRWMLIALLWLTGCASAPRTPPGEMAAEEYGEDYDARRMLLMGDIARRFEDYDLAVQSYQKIAERFPNTRWATQAASAIEAAKADAKQHLALWDTEAGGTPAGEHARRLLLMGDVAYKHGDALLALKFYERTYTVSSDSMYGRKAASKIRWIRRWKNPGPQS